MTTTTTLRTLRRQSCGMAQAWQKVVVGHSWGQIAVGTALSCGQMGCFGAYGPVCRGHYWCVLGLSPFVCRERTCACLCWCALDLPVAQGRKTWTLCQAPCSRRLDTAPVTIALMKKQSLWFGEPSRASHVQMMPDLC